MKPHVQPIQATKGDLWLELELRVQHLDPVESLDEGAEELRQLHLRQQVADASDAAPART